MTQKNRGGVCCDHAVQLQKLQGTYETLAQENRVLKAIIKSQAALIEKLELED